MDPYINIGTPRGCLFVYLSHRLLNALRSHPFLFDAIEEAVVSAKNGYYAIGIIVYFELLRGILNSNSPEDTKKRNEAAHDVLKIRPSKKSYDEILERFKDEAKKRYLKELAKTGNKDLYMKEIDQKWQEFMSELSINSPI